MTVKKKNYLDILCVILTILVLIVFALKIGGFNFGIGPYRIGFVMTESMEPIIPVHGLLLEKRISDVKEIKENDIVTFLHEDTDKKIIHITHRVLEIKDGYILTKGDNNLEPDPFKTLLTDVSYKVVCVYPYFFESISLLVFVCIVISCFKKIYKKKEI